MRLFARLRLSRPAKDWAPQCIPWGDRPSLYAHVAAHLDPYTGQLSPDQTILPDEPVVSTPGCARLPGERDGLSLLGDPSAGWPDERGELYAERVLGAVRRVLRRPSARRLAAMYDLIRSAPALEYVDTLLGLLSMARESAARPVRRLGRWLATGAPDREPVKLGIALLGLFPAARDSDLLLTLGSHDEFTLFCANGLSNVLDDPTDPLWELGRRTRHWGRVHAVAHLPERLDLRIRRWLLRDACRQTGMAHILAPICAERADLAGALAPESVDDELLAGAGGIVYGLCQGPEPVLAHYEGGVDLLERFLYHMSAHADAGVLAGVIDAVHAFLDDERRDWRRLVKHGWTPEKRSLLAEACYRIVERRAWRPVVG